MTLCRKCGKEISDGQELCEECQGAELQIDEAYLDDLMQSMERELEQEQEQEPVVLEPMEEPQEELEEEPQEELEEEPEEEPQEEEVPADLPEDVPTEESVEEENLDELLTLLSRDYEELDEPILEEEPVEEVMEESPAEATLFREGDDGGDIFADDVDALSVEDVFDDALSAVDYQEAEEEPLEEILDEFVSPEESSEEFVDMALDSLALDEQDVPLPSEGTLDQEENLESKTPKEKKESIWKRVFGNIITEESAEQEAKERELEEANAEEKALAREEKKKQAEEKKAEKAEQAKLEKEKKAAEKAEKAAAKAAEKEEKKRLKAEMEEKEVVGRINPLGASIVMVFFGLICVLVILGSQTTSYTRSVRNAESSFLERDYKSAYESLAGVEVSESSQEMKDKVRICMQLQRQLDAYQNYYNMRMYLESLDSLMKGIRSYDSNKGKAEEYEILGQYNELKGKLLKQLHEEFGVSESQARSINSVKTQEGYTSRLEHIIAQWQKRNKEDER